jgi:hypothetical protein
VGQLKFTSANWIKGLGHKVGTGQANGRHYDLDSHWWTSLSNAIVNSSGYSNSSIIPFFGVVAKGGTKEMRYYRVYPNNKNSIIGSAYIQPPSRITGDWNKECNFNNWNVGD